MNNRNQPCPCNSGKKFKKCCGIPVARVWAPPPRPPEPEHPEQKPQQVYPSPRRNPGLAMMLTVAALGLGGSIPNNYRR